MWLFRQRDKKSCRLQPPCMPILHVMQTIYAYCSCDKQLCKSQSKSSENYDHWKKNMCSKKVQKLKKKNWLRLGLNPQPSWLTTNIVLTGIQTKQISISNQHNWVPRWRTFNFAQDPFRCVLGMPSNSYPLCFDGILHFFIFKQLQNAS